MGIQVQWDDVEQTIIRATFDTAYTWEEYFGLFVSVGVGNPLTRMILSTLIQVVRMKTPSAYAGSLDEAYAAIKRHRAKEGIETQTASTFEVM